MLSSPAAPGGARSRSHAAKTAPIHDAARPGERRNDMSSPEMVPDDVHLTLTSKAGPVNILRGVSFMGSCSVACCKSIAILAVSGG